MSVTLGKTKQSACAALDPIAVVAVEDTVDHAHLGMMKLAAYDAVDAAAPRFARHGPLVVRDEVHGVLDPVLEECRERPVGQAELAVSPVEEPIEAQCRGIGPVAQDGEPAGVAYDAIELVAVNHQQLPSRG